MLYVFLKNKIIGADAAAPLIMEFRARNPGRKVKFVVPSLKALKAIETNVVLHDALLESGEIVQIGRRASGLFGRIESKMRGLLWLAATAIRSLSPRVIHMHFGALERWPLRLLFHMAPKRSLLADSAFHGFTDRMRAFAELKADREEVVLPTHMTAALVFHDQSFVRQGAAKIGVPCFRMDAPHALPVWQGWLAEKAPRYLDKLAKEQPVLDRPFFVTFVLGYFGELAFLRNQTGCVELFEETVDIVTGTVPDVPLVLKPHVVTDMDQLRRSLAKFPRAKTVVCNLHPAMLAARSYAVISNYYSTTQSTAAQMGVPTVEYSEYGQRAYAITEGGSVRPDHIKYFIQRDAARLRDIVLELTADRERPMRLPMSQPHIDERVFSFLADGWLSA